MAGSISADVTGVTILRPGQWNLWSHFVQAHGNLEMRLFLTVITMLCTGRMPHKGSSNESCRQEILGAKGHSAEIGETKKQ